MSTRTVQRVSPLLLLVTQLFGCGGEALVGPAEEEPAVDPPVEGATGQLSAQEALVISDEFAGATVAGLNWGLTIARAANLAGIVWIGETQAPTGITVLIDRSHSCEGGGTIEVSGRLQGTIDRDNRRLALLLVKAEEIRDCRTTGGGTYLTVHAESDLTITGDFLVQSGRRSGVFKLAGAFEWESDDGRAGRCDVDLSGTWLSDGGWSVDGAVCDHEVSPKT